MKRTSLSIHPGIRIFPALAAALLLFLATGSSLAADLPAGSAPVTTDNVANPEAPAATDNVANPERPTATDNIANPEPPTATDNGWVERTHSWVQKGLSETVVWFDRFFGDDQMVVTGRPESYLRWKSEFWWDEVDRFSFRSTVRASLRLPRLKDRWHLVFTSESRGDPNTIIPEDPGNPGLNPASQVRTSSTELVYDILRTPRSLLDAGVGVKVTIPPNAFVRTRFQHARPLAPDMLGRLTVTAYWDAQDGPGESNQLDFERWLAPPTLLRWSNSFTIEEKSKNNGWAWGTDLSLLHAFSPKSAITLSGGASGYTRPAWIAQKYQVLARYRRNVWRKWLFLEGEPYINWPRKEDGSRESVWGAILRVEILFTGVGAYPQDGGGNWP